MANWWAIIDGSMAVGCLKQMSNMLVPDFWPMALDISQLIVAE